MMKCNTQKLTAVCILFVWSIITTINLRAQNISLEWVNSFGSEKSEHGEIIMDNVNNFYLVGTIVDSIDLDPGTQKAMEYAKGTGNIFFAKYDKDGNYIWSKSIGGSSTSNQRRNMAIDDQNNLYIVGTFGATMDFNPNGSGQDTLEGRGSSDVFVAKYDQDGNY